MFRIDPLGVESEIVGRLDGLLRMLRREEDRFITALAADLGRPAIEGYMADVKATINEIAENAEKARAIADQARTIRIPVHMIETINKLIRTSRYLVQEFGREPRPEEIAEKMEIPIDKVRKVLKIAREPISLETPIGEEEDSHLGDFIEDKKFMLPSEAAVSMNLAEQTRKVLATLTPREEKVLRMRFGIGEKADHTLEEVGQDFTVTRERIRQIEAKALRKLRHPTRSRKLKSFIDT